MGKRYRQASGITVVVTHDMWKNMFARPGVDKAKSMGYVADNLKDLQQEFPNCLSNVYCGADCPDGWKPLVREALVVLEYCGARVAQIKEKFGGLRLYYDEPFGEWQTPWHGIACAMATQLAERASFKTCQICGKPGKQSHGAEGALCESCKKK